MKIYRIGVDDTIDEVDFNPHTLEILDPYSENIFGKKIVSKEEILKEIKWPYYSTREEAVLVLKEILREQAKFKLLVVDAEAKRKAYFSE